MADAGEVLRGVGAAGAAALLALSPGAGSADAAATDMRDRGWQGVKRVAIAVDLRGDARGPAGGAAVADDLCARFGRIAGEGSPYPVSCVSTAAAAAAKLDTAVLAVEAALAAGDGGARPRLTFTVRRTMTAGLEPAPIPSGTSPRTLPLDRSAGGAAALDAAIAAALAEVLPWRRSADRLKPGLLPRAKGG